MTLKLGYAVVTAIFLVFFVNHARGPDAGAAVSFADLLVGGGDDHGRSEFGLTMPTRSLQERRGSPG